MTYQQLLEPQPKQGGSFLDTMLNSAYMPELHFRGFDTGFKKYNFAGPGTDLKRRLNENGLPKPDSIPVNRVDASAYRHDLGYNNIKDNAGRKHLDNIMIDELTEISRDPKARWTERLDARIVNGFMKTKRFFGLGKNKRRKKKKNKK